MHALVHRCINLHTKFEVPIFTNSRDMIREKIKNGSRDPDHALLGVAYHSEARI